MCVNVYTLCVYMYVELCMCVCMLNCVHACVHACMSACMRAELYVCVWVDMLYICIYTCILKVFQMAKSCNNATIWYFPQLTVCTAPANDTHAS